MKKTFALIFLCVMLSGITLQALSFEEILKGTTKALNFLNENKSEIALVISVLSAVIYATRQKMKFKDAILLILNTLKDEDKMNSSGTEFTKDAIIKLEEIADKAGTVSAALDTAKKEIEDINRKKGIKIGSYKGKPIYLRDAVGLLGMFH